VEFTGRLPHAEVAAALRGARALVQHSMATPEVKCEGTPVSVMEAGASGLPVVATRNGGIPDVVLDGRTGFLVEEGDVAAMAGRMIELARDPVLAGRLDPLAWFLDIAGLSARPVLWAGLVVLGGWLAALAGEGLRRLVPLPRAWRRLALAGFAPVVVLAGGGWSGVAVAVIGAAAFERGQGVSIGCAVLCGWITGATWVQCGWPAPLWDSLLLLLAASAAIAVSASREGKAGKP
jgi:hypothetical protein